jgi:hypothetical protein
MTTPQPPGQAEATRQLLLTAFGDAESTIRATDTKASIALVVHGFIFAGVLGILSRIGPWFSEASCSFRAIIVGCIALTAVSFMASVTQLLRCVAPAPSATVPNVPLKGVFYLPGSAGAIKGVALNTLTLGDFKAKVNEMSEADILEELMGELIKVSAIRSRKVSLAKSGFILLGAAIALSIVLLCAIGLHQL